MSEKEYFNEIKRDGMTSVHGIHVKVLVNNECSRGFRQNSNGTCQISMLNFLLIIFLCISYCQVLVNNECSRGF